MLLNTTKAMSALPPYGAQDIQALPTVQLHIQHDNMRLGCQDSRYAALGRFSLSDDGHARRRQHDGNARADQGGVIG